MFLAPSRSDLDKSILITTLFGVPPENPTVKHRQLAPTVGPLANDRQKNPMASLDNNPVLKKGTVLRIGSWIFVAGGSGSFKSYSINQDAPEVSEAAKRHEFDEFIDQLKEIGFSDLNDETRIQREFGAIKAKTLSELEEDLERLLEDTKQETSMDGKTLHPSCIRSAEPSPRKKKSKASFKKTTHKRKPSKVTFSNIDNINEKIEHCLQLAEDTFNINTSREKIYN